MTHQYNNGPTVIKIDLNEKVSSEINDAICISAMNQTGIDNLKKQICNFTNTNNLDSNNTIITNQRHYEQLIKTLAELELVIKGLEDGLSSDLLAINIKESLYHLGLITGEVSSDDLLGNIFGKFCIGK